MAVTIRAKFVCELKAHGPENQEEGSVTLRAVTQTDSEAEDYFRYTPWGEIKMGLLNASAFARFEVGRHYYVEFSPVQPVPPPTTETREHVFDSATFEMLADAAKSGDLESVKQILGVDAP